MKYLYTLVFFGFVFYLQMLHCSASDLTCSLKTRKDYAAQFLKRVDKTGRIIASLSPKEFIESGHYPDVLFGEGLMEYGDDVMTLAWLKNFLDDETFQNAPIKQASLDAMLSYAADKPHTSLKIINVLLEHGADPCVGYAPPIKVTADHLIAARSRVSVLSRKLYGMVVAASNKEVCEPQREVMRLERFTQLRELLGDYSQRVTHRDYAEHCEIWSKLCGALGAQSKHSVKQASPLRLEDGSFGKFAAKCFEALQRKNEYALGYYSAED